MDVINEIIKNSALGELPHGYQFVVLLLFFVIVITLLIMLALLFTQGAIIRIQFGY